MSAIRTRLWSGIVVLGTLAGCGVDGSARSTLEAVRSTLTPPPPPPDTIPEMLDYAADLGVNIADMKKLPSGVLYEDRDPGQGDEAVPGDELEVRLQGWLPDGTPIDSLTATIRLGAGDVMQGLDLGLAGMRAGGRRRFVIPPGLAFGAEGRDGVPPSAVVVYDAELLAVRR